MAIPDFQTLMLPVLRASADGEVKTSDVVFQLGSELGLTEEELSELLPSGKQTTFANRVNWAKSYLGKAGLVTLTRRGYFQASGRGKQVLANPPARITIKFLEAYPEFMAFRKASSPSAVSPPPEQANLKDLTPDEVMRSAHAELDASLAAELLSKILAAPPDFFERLVVQLLTAMGYGGSAIEAGKALGKSGDGGVDGVIDPRWPPQTAPLMAGQTAPGRTTGLSVFFLNGCLASEARQAEGARPGSGGQATHPAGAVHRLVLWAGGLSMAGGCAKISRSSPPSRPGAAPPP